MLYSDIQIEFIREEIIKKGNTVETRVIDLDEYQHLLNISPDDNVTDLGVKQTIYKTETSVIRHFHSVALGRIPVMLHSNICALAGQQMQTLREMGECPYGQGGYFIINGKEKTIIAQERQMENKIFISKETGSDDKNIIANYQYITEVRSIFTFWRHGFFSIFTGHFIIIRL